MAYRFAGKQKALSFGSYPLISLAEAREKRDEARKLLIDLIDPGESRKAAKQRPLDPKAVTFETVAREWLTREAKELDAGPHARNLSMMETHAFPVIGALPVAEVEPPGPSAPRRRDRGQGDQDGSAHLAEMRPSLPLRHPERPARLRRSGTEPQGRG